MNTLLIVFYALASAYLVGMGIFVLVKYIRNKRRVKRECEKIDKEN